MQTNLHRLRLGCQPRPESTCQGCNEKRLLDFENTKPLPLDLEHGQVMYPCRTCLEVNNEGREDSEWGWGGRDWEGLQVDEEGYLTGKKLIQIAYSNGPGEWISPGGKTIKWGKTLLKFGEVVKNGIKFLDYNQARNAALKWLLARRFKAEKKVIGKFGASKGKPIGMSSADGNIGFRVEYDGRNGAHINVWFGKEKGPHFIFEGTEETVNEIIKRFL